MLMELPETATREKSIHGRRRWDDIMNYFVWLHMETSITVGITLVQVTSGHAWIELNTMLVSYNVTTVIESSKAVHSAPTDTKPSVSFACIMFSLY